MTDPKLFEQIKTCLLRTLRQSLLAKELVESLGREVRWHGRTDNEVAHYCNECEVSVLDSADEEGWAIVQCTHNLDGGVCVCCFKCIYHTFLLRRGSTFELTKFNETALLDC